VDSLEPFFELLNVITSTHRSAQGAGASDFSLRRAINALTAARGLRP
jgi:hypothetical protein